MRDFLWHVFRVGLNPMIVVHVTAHINAIIELVDRGGAQGFSQKDLDRIAYHSSMHATLLDRARVELRVTGNPAGAYAPVLAKTSPSHAGVTLYDVRYDRKAKVLTATLSFHQLASGFQQKAPPR